MWQTVTVRRLSAGSMFKISLLGLAVPIFLFAIACGLLSLGGLSTIRVNGRPVVGWNGLLASFVIGPVLALVFTCVGWVGLFLGSWLCSKFFPMTLTFESAKEPAHDAP